MLGTPEIIIIAVIVLLLFGSTQLPKLARSLGQAQKEFKTGLNEDGSEKASKSGEEEGTTKS